MFTLTRQARHLNRYRQIVQVLVWQGFGLIVEQLGLLNIFSFPARLLLGTRSTPPATAAARLRQALTELGPTFVKVGQLLSTRHDLLPPAFAVELDKLQDTVPPFPPEQAIELIEQELGQPLPALFREFQREPIAAASIGQVHAAVLHSGAQVVVKVQRPDIQRLIETDLAIINDLAALAQERQIFQIQYDLVELAWEFSLTLRSELDYLREAANADRFRQNFAGSSLIYIPTVYWNHTSSRVVTYERLFGIKIDDIVAMEAAGINRPRLARNSLQVILEEVFNHGFFHADPHPGNFFALKGDVIGAIDFGQVGIMDRETTRQMLLLLLAVSRHDVDDALRALQRLGLVRPHTVTPALRRDTQYLINRYVDRPLEQLSFSELADALYAISNRHRLRMPAPMALLLKTFVMIEGTGSRIDPKLDVFAIARPYAEQAFVTQLSPLVILEQLSVTLRDLTETTIALPKQIGDVLYQLESGELVVRTREEELRVVSKAMLAAANRIAIGVVLAALLIGMSMIIMSSDVRQWNSTLLLILSGTGIVALSILGLVFVFVLLRRRNIE